VGKKKRGTKNVVFIRGATSMKLRKDDDGLLLDNDAKKALLLLLEEKKDEGGGSIFAAEDGSNVPWLFTSSAHSRDVIPGLREDGLPRR